MAYGQVNADVIGTSVTGSNLGAGNASLMKNRIINGAMVIDQRNAGASVTPTSTSSATYTLDRWAATISVASKFSVQQTSTAPVGFVSSLKITSASAYTVGSGDYFLLDQVIEGYNIADLNWGSANAKTVTLSFWVQSSLTGTFGGALQSSGGARSYPFSYTISSANTWEQKTITIAGDTSGTWNSTNNAGIYVRFGLGVGSTYSGTAGSWSGSNYFSATGATSVVGTNGATFYITGVQLEVGSSATGFEYRQYQQELALCQRYCYVISNTNVNNNMLVANGYVFNSTNINVSTYLPVSPRVPPTGITVTNVGGAFCNQPAGNFNLSSLVWGGAATSTAVLLSAAATGATSGQPCNILANSGSGSFSITFTGMEL